MARTDRNIYYPDDYNEVADIPKDLQDMAESIDSAIDAAVNEATYDDTALKARVAATEGDISDIKAEQTQQNTDIQTNANAISALQGTVTAQGQTIENLDNNKVDKVQGKGLSTEDFTTPLRTKLEGLENYDDTEVKQDISDIQEEQTTQNEDIEELQSQVETLQEDLDNAEAEIDNLQQDVEDLRGASYKVEGTGTDIALNNTAQAKLLKNELSGRTEQESLSGKNLFDKDSPNIIQNQYLLPAGNTGNNQNFGISDYISVLENTQYSLQPYRGLGSAICFYDENKTFLSGIQLSQANPNFTTPASCKYLRISFQKDDKDIEQLEQGSTATDFEPFCGGTASPNPEFPQNIRNVTGNANVKIQNKNLMLAQKIVEDSNNASVYLTQDGFIRYVTSSNRMIIKPTIIKENTAYTFKLIGKSGTTDQNGITFSAYYTDGTTEQVVSITRIDTNEFTMIFTTNANKTLDYIRSAWTSSKEAFLKIDGSMILEGSYTSETIPEYVPHQEQNLPFTFSEGQSAMQGTELKDDGIHNIRKQVVWDGSEDEHWIRSNSSELFYSSMLTSTAKQNGEIVCNYFTKIPVTATLKNGEVKYNTATSTLIQFKYLDLTTVTQWREWLATHNLVVEYELDEEEIIPYNETQQAQYNAIKQARSYDDITYITSESDELGFNMNVVAVADANKVIDNQNNEIDTIKSRLDLLEG